MHVPFIYAIYEFKYLIGNYIDNFGILAIYYFKPDIFNSLKKTKRGKNNEFQLTDGIQQLINDGKKVLAIPLTKDDIELDVGMVESFRDAQMSSYKRA